MYLGYHIKICELCNFAFDEHEDLSTCPHPKRRQVDDENDQEIKRLFHKLWSKDVDLPGYRKEIKPDWMELQRLLQARGIDI